MFTFTGLVAQNEYNNDYTQFVHGYLVASCDYIVYKSNIYAAIRYSGDAQ